MAKDVFQTILDRRSIRSYQQRPLEKADLDRIIECGFAAPSAHFLQPWHITVVQSPEALEKVNAAFRAWIQTKTGFKDKLYKPDYHVFHHAPTLISLSGDPSAPMAAMDCALMAENMVLAASALDIGSCFIGYLSFLWESPEGKAALAELGVPHTHKPVLNLAMGYKNGPDPAAKPRDTSKINYV